jgi:NAD-dependent DNA ligase
MQEILNSLLAQERVVDMFSLCRFMYRIGSPIVNDDFYNKLEEYCKNNNIAEDFRSRTYDDDPIPVNLLREFGLEKHIPIDQAAKSEYYRYLDEDKSLSIEAVTGYDTSYKFFMGVRDQDLVMSLKVDGINDKRLVKDEELKLSVSRGRNGAGFDFTENIMNAVPRYYDGIKEEVKIFSENYVESNMLDYFKEKYDKESYKTEKSSAISLLRVKHEQEDYQYLKSLSFNAEGLGATLSGTLSKLKEMGLSVVPYIVIPKGTVPTNYGEFTEWLKDMLDAIFQMGIGIPSDGVVVEVDDYSYSAEIKNQYSSRNIALKLEHWSFKYYKGRVTEIVICQRRVYASCRVKIEPLITSDNTQAKIINVFNPSILTSNGIVEGSEIYFERNSGAVNIMLQGEKLQKLMLESPTE